MTKGGAVVAKALASEEVEHYFTVPAEQILRIIIESEFVKVPKPINAAFEPGAGFMALIYSRVTGKVGVCVLTAGPGIFSAVNPIAMAHVESDPLVVIASTPPRDIAYRNALHALFTDSDQLSVFRSITKRQLRVTQVSHLPDILSKAFHIAQSHRPGPVYVEIPADILDEEIENFDYVRISPVKPSAPNDLIDKVVEVLKNAQKPVILAGRGITLSSAEKEVITLAEMLDIPICTTVMGKGIIPPTHPLYAGIAAGRLGDKVAEKILEEADVVLAIGVRFSQMGTGRYSMKIKGALIHVNISPDEIGRVFKPDIAIVADAKDFLSKMLIKIKKEGIKVNRRSKEYLSRLWKSVREEKIMVKKSSIIEPWEVVDNLRKITDEDTIFICDVGAHRIETFTMPIYKPRTYITTTSYVSMGFAIPGAIAAKLAKKENIVIGIVGDGGFLMTGLELITGVRYNIPAIIVVFNDSSYRVLRIYEKIKYGTELTHKLPHVDFSNVARSLGAHGIRIESRDELKDGLVKALSLAKNKPVVVDVIVNPEAVPTPMTRLYGVHYISELGKA